MGAGGWGGGGESNNNQKVEDELTTLFLTKSPQNYGSQHRFQLSNILKDCKTCHVKKIIINIYNNKKNYRKEACGREKESGEYMKWGFLHLKNSNTNGKSWMDYEKYVRAFCHLVFFFTCDFLVCLSETELFLTA